MDTNELIFSSEKLSEKMIELQPTDAFKLVQESHKLTLPTTDAEFDETELFMEEVLNDMSLGNDESVTFDGALNALLDEDVQEVEDFIRSEFGIEEDEVFLDTKKLVLNDKTDYDTLVENTNKFNNEDPILQRRAVPGPVLLTPPMWVDQ